MRSLSTLKIDGSTFFGPENDDAPDLTCPKCKGECTVNALAEGVEIEEFTPTAEQVEKHGLEAGTDCYRILGVDSLADEVYDFREDAEEAIKNEGEEEDCDECSGTGYLEVIWNTIFNTGFHCASKSLPAVFAGNVVAFEYDDEVWFGLSGCGMDMTPYLAAAWIEAFPNCQWLPENFLDVSHITNGYNRSVVGEVGAKLIAERAEETLRQQVVSSKRDHERVCAFLKEEHKKAREAKKTKKAAKPKK